MEATSEKIALGWHLDGRVAAVVGTHTHVPTADGRVLPKGTAYLTDAGMCGPYAGVLGRAVERSSSFLDGMKRRFPVADADVRIAGCLVDIDAQRGLANASSASRLPPGARKPHVRRDSYGGVFGASVPWREKKRCPGHASNLLG